MLDVLGLEKDSEFWRTLNKYSDQKERLLSATKKFLAWKNEHPFNGALPGKFPGYGSNDKKFEAKGRFGNDYAHAHLTHNVSIVYSVDRETNTIKIYGLYTHDDIGTGRPPNPNRQAQAVQRWGQQKFDASQSVTQIDAGDKKDKTEKPVAKKVDYTQKKVQPKPSITQPATVKKEDPVKEFVSMIDSKWPDRGFAHSMSKALTLQDKLTVLNGELRYLEIIKKRAPRLYPNQVEYAKGISTLISYLADQQRRR